MIGDIDFFREKSIIWFEKEELERKLVLDIFSEEVKYKKYSVKRMRILNKGYIWRKKQYGRQKTSEPYRSFSS